jgi:hypothetical protein
MLNNVGIIAPREGKRAAHMTIPVFSESELNIVEERVVSPAIPGKTRIYSYPVTPREAVFALYDKKPIWQILDFEFKKFIPSIIPDTVARAFAREAAPFDPVAQGGGKDMFGIDWEYVEVAGGSMVKPGTPLLKDANDWREVIKFPNVDAWDWASSAQENNGTYLTKDNFYQTWIFTGWFERLISFMDFEEAVIAMIDEDQTQAVKELFDALSDLYIDIIDHHVKYYDRVDSFLIHDDWGSALNSFFSPAVAEEMIVPYMKKVTDHIHSHGRIAELHSCGMIYNQVPNIIAAGFDTWSPQFCNDVGKIYDTYGDELLVGTFPPQVPEDATEEEQRAAARAYVERFCDPQKPSYLSVYGYESLTTAFREELYVRSRERYSASSVL